MHFTHFLKAFINKILKYIVVCSYIGSNIPKKKGMKIKKAHEFGSISNITYILSNLCH